MLIDESWAQNNIVRFMYFYDMSMATCSLEHVNLLKTMYLLNKIKHIFNILLKKNNVI